MSFKKLWMLAFSSQTETEHWSSHLAELRFIRASVEKHLFVVWSENGDVISFQVSRLS